MKDAGVRGDHDRVGVPRGARRGARRPRRLRGRARSGRQRLEQSFSRRLHDARTCDGRHARGPQRRPWRAPRRPGRPRGQRVRDESRRRWSASASRSPSTAGDVVYHVHVAGPDRAGAGSTTAPGRSSSVRSALRERVSRQGPSLPAQPPRAWTRSPATTVAGRYAGASDRPVRCDSRRGEGDPATLTVRLARAARDLLGSRGGLRAPDVAAVGRSTPRCCWSPARTAVLDRGSKARDAARRARRDARTGSRRLSPPIAEPGLFLSGGRAQGPAPARRWRRSIERRLAAAGATCPAPAARRRCSGIRRRLGTASPAALRVPLVATMRPMAGRPGARRRRGGGRRSSATSRGRAALDPRFPGSRCRRRDAAGRRRASRRSPRPASSPSASRPARSTAPVRG